MFAKGLEIFRGGFWDLFVMKANKILKDVCKKPRKARF